MSILLESHRKSESREGGGGAGIVQTPGPFYNGNPSSSIWGSSFWKNAGLLDKSTPFDFGPSIPPPPVETLSSERSQDRPEVFVFGSVPNTARSSSSSPGRGDKPGTGDRSGVGKSAGGDGKDRPRPGISIRPDVEHPRDEMERVGSMLRDFHIRATTSQAAPSTFPNVVESLPRQDFPSSPSFVDHTGKDHRQGQFSPAGDDQKEFSKTTTFTLGTPTPHHQTGNPRPRFSKLRKSSHPAKGKGAARDRNFSDLSSRADSPTAAANAANAANFQPGEPSIGLETPVMVDPGIRRQADKRNEDGSSAEVHGTRQPYETQEVDDSREIPSTSIFIFTSMKDAVPVIAETQDSGKDVQSLAADLTSLKMDEANPSSESIPSSNPSPAFVFGTHSSKVEQSTPQGTFVFMSPGGAAASISRKKRGIRKVSDRSRGVRSTSTSAADEQGSQQGSPMDFSPCPDTGARLSPQMAENYSEAEEHDQHWNHQFQFYSEPSDDVENLSAAAAELSLGSQSDEPKETSVPNHSGTFAFTASSASAPVRRKSRRTPKVPASRSKANVARSAPTVEAHKMDLDNTKFGKDSLKQGAEPSVNFTTPDTPSKRPPAEHAGEKWRLRGNQAYASGDFPKAEEYYTLGINSTAPNETAQSYIHASMLCYSNRAATRMVVGRMREALGDCLRAIAIDPNFLRVRIRAGSCHLSLGEIEAAGAFFQDCFNRASDVGSGDSKVASEASEGLRKTRQADEYFQRAWELLSLNDYTSTLTILNEALLTCPYSEIFLELKAHSLLTLRRYNDVFQLCEQTLVLAERNWIHSQQSQVVRGFRPGSSPKVWRSWATSKALFYLGRLKESLDGLHKLGDILALSGDERISYIQQADLETLSQFIGLIQQLLRYKAVGNEAFQAGRHTEAVEHYTAALALNCEARPFNAVLFCNRAAASQALGHIADAIADSSRAVSLNSTYVKAISRRVTLHTLIRDHGQACSDLRRLISLLETDSSYQELKQARERLANAEDDVKKNLPVDHYLILGLVSSCSAAEIKKAYRKLALRHHPDKAAQLVRTDGGEDGKDVGEEIRSDAERLFKLIGEAYAILSDPVKRSRYDAEEDLRKLGSRGAANNQNSENHRYDRSHRRQRDRWEWSGYAHQYQRWQNGPDAAQPDTYARQSRYNSAGKSAEYSWDDLYS